MPNWIWWKWNKTVRTDYLLNLLYSKSVYLCCHFVKWTVYLFFVFYYYFCKAPVETLKSPNSLSVLLLHLPYSTFLFIPLISLWAVHLLHCFFNMSRVYINVQTIWDFKFGHDPLTLKSTTEYFSSLIFVEVNMAILAWQRSVEPLMSIYLCINWIDTPTVRVIFTSICWLKLNKPAFVNLWSDVWGKSHVFL